MPKGRPPDDVSKMIEVVDLLLAAVGERVRREMQGAGETPHGGTPARDALVKFIRDNP